MPEFTVWGAPFLDSTMSIVARLIPILVLGEFAYLFYFRRQRTHLKDFMNNFSNGLVHRIVNLLIWTPFYFYLHSVFQKWALFEINISSVVHWLGIFILTDFCYYWFHRALHQVPIFWTLHDSHHSSPYVNWLSAFRLNWLLGGLRALSHLPLTLLGVPPQATYFCYILVLVFQIFVHSEVFEFPDCYREVF